MAGLVRPARLPISEAREPLAVLPPGLARLLIDRFALDRARARLRHEPLLLRVRLGPKLGAQRGGRVEHAAGGAAGRLVGVGVRFAPTLTLTLTNKKP